jgi:hypothetical protein
LKPAKVEQPGSLHGAKVKDRPPSSTIEVEEPDDEDLLGYRGEEEEEEKGEKE